MRLVMRQVLALSRVFSPVAHTSCAAPRASCAMSRKHGRFERFGHRFFLTDNAKACPSRGFMNPSLAAVSAFGLRAPETFETAISAGARHMASERLARDMQGYHGDAAEYRTVRWGRIKLGNCHCSGACFSPFHNNP